MTQSVQKAVSYAAVLSEYNPSLLTQKAAAYTAILDLVEFTVTVQKAAAYTVIQQPYNPTIAVQKGLTYLAVQDPPIEKLAVQSAKVYSVIFSDSTGNLIQPDASFKPTYITNMKPSVDFGENESLITMIQNTGIHTLIFYKPDGTFEVIKIFIEAGAFEIPKISFNQLYINFGRMKSADIIQIQNEMIANANN